MSAERSGWAVLGHSWGSDLAVRYALDHPERVAAVVGIAGHGLHKDRNWSEIYEAQRHTEKAIHIDWKSRGPYCSERVVPGMDPRARAVSLACGLARSDAVHRGI